MMSYGDHPRSQAQGIIVLFVMQTPIQETNVTITETPCAQTIMNLHSECTIVSEPPDLEKSMEFSRAGEADAAQSQVIKVWSINYTFVKGVKTPFIDTLEVELMSNGAKKAVMKNRTYTDVMEMDGGEDAVTEFGPISDTPIEKAEIGNMYCHRFVRLSSLVPWYEIITRALGGYLKNSQCMVN